MSGEVPESCAKAWTLGPRGTTWRRRLLRCARWLPCANLLHARPATHPVEGQRLLRAEQGPGRKPTGRRFWIDTDWLDGARLMTDSHVRWLDRKRAKMREASEESGSTA